MAKDNVNFRYVLSIVIAVIVTWLFHEFAHWLTSEVMGYDAIMTLNSTSYVDKRPAGFQEMMVSAAGPAVTLTQALLIYLILESGHWSKHLFPYLLTPCYMRVLAAGMNAINPNDEGRVSLYFEYGLYTLPIVVSLVLLTMTVIIAWKQRLTAGFLGRTLLIIMIVSSILILADQFFRIRIL